MRTPSILAIALALVAGIAGLAGGVWWFSVRPAQLMEQAADRVVAQFASGELDDADFTAPAAEELKKVYAGMGALRPTVTRLGELKPGEPGRVSTELAWSWVIHEGKASWDYTTGLELVRDGDAWKAVYGPWVVAPGLTELDVLRASRLTPTRGSILGEAGEPLATNTAAWRLGIDKTVTDEATAVESAGKLATELGMDAAAFSERVRKAGPRAFVEARILRQHAPADQELVAKAERWIGVRAIPTTFPLGRTSSFARPLLGVVGDATAEQVEKSAGTIRAGDLVGRGGLQEARNHVLAGTTGFVVNIAGNDGKNREVFRVDALDGSSVQTSIVVPLQELAESLLAGVEPASALVAIRTSDGAIVAAASGPGSGGMSTATLGQYAPGSTFKTVSTLAMLRAGVSADATVTCSDGITVDGFRINNYQGYPASALGDVPLRTAFAQSCNTAFVGFADRVAQADLASAAAALGLTAEPSLVVGGFSGIVPTEATDVEHAASFIGQGKVLASPLGMATVAASIAHGGPVVPWLVDEPGRPVPPEPAHPLTPEEADVLRDLMRAVVTDGSGGALRGLPGGPVLAKTGTASYGPSNPPRYHGWMIAIQDDLAVAAFVEDATSGSADAGPLVAGFLRGAR